VGIDAGNDHRYPVFVEVAPMSAGIETRASLYLAIARTAGRG
jgi:cholesterol oxidase